MEFGDKTTWVSSLPFVKFTTNSNILDFIGKVPFEFVLGAMAVDPIDIRDGLQRVDSAYRFVNRLRKAILEAQRNLKKV